MVKVHARLDTYIWLAADLRQSWRARFWAWLNHKYGLEKLAA